MRLGAALIRVLYIVLAFVHAVGAWVPAFAKDNTENQVSGTVIAVGITPIP